MKDLTVLVQDNGDTAASTLEFATDQYVVKTFELNLFNLLLKKKYCISDSYSSLGLLCRHILYSSKLLKVIPSTHVYPLLFIFSSCKNSKF